jgi:hypothetical protein
MALTKTEILSLQYFSENGVFAKVVANSTFDSLSLQYPSDSGFITIAASDVATSAILKVGGVSWSAINKIGTVTLANIDKVGTVAV